MLTVEKCLVCGSNRFEPFLICKDYTVSQENFNIVTCKSCSFKFTNPRPNDSVLGGYYKSENYVSHTNTKKGLVNKLYHLVRDYTLKNKIKLISTYVSRGTILDYGCGTGMFLSACKSSGWDVVGLEPDDSARKIASDQYLSVYSNKENVNAFIKEKQFDAITLWHVLEHVTDMTETLLLFKTKLKKDGVLIIAVPNHVSHDAVYYKEFWAAYDVPRHLHHFDLKSMTSLLENNGFKLVETKPMKFDSFYVSMLSEKCKTGKVNLIKAFWIGLMSNFKAKDSSSYSSTIYVFKHA
jgi:2-polyprenyl-3-methyl-5-hydroxy-6-metoxy-1,4-benzoquinol methylase